MEQPNQTQPYESESGEATFFEERLYIEQVLETIDNEQLSNFMVEQLRPAGFQEEVLKDRFFSTDHITLDEELPHAVAWADGDRINFEPINFLENNHNLLAWVEMSKPSKNAYDRDRRLFEVSKLQAVQTFVHEQLHHLTVTEYEHLYRERPSVSENIFTRKVGVEKQVSFERIAYANQGDAEVKTDTEQREFFRALNEGLTELMAQELIAEYARQNPLIDDVELFRQIKNIWIEHGPYKVERLKVEQLATILAEMTEVTTDIMLKSFFHEYVNNGHLLPPEFKWVIAEYVSSDVDDSKIEEIMTETIQSLSDESFNAESPVNVSLSALIELMPKEKADRCKDALAELYKKYHISQSLE